MEVTKTEMGFAQILFKDLYGAKCSIQKSSLATKGAIWIGVDDANPQIMASDARKLGLGDSNQNGWIKYEIPEQVLLSTRMHLTRDMVKEMLPLLKRFVKTGDLNV